MLRMARSMVSALLCVGITTLNRNDDLMSFATAGLQLAAALFGLPLYQNDRVFAVDGKASQFIGS